MSKSYDEGARVAWDWGEGTAEGEVREVHTERVTREIKGTEVVRDADEDCPAYVIEQQDGSRVLKSHSELRPA